jgi:F1F0 ATPase subunit 2
MNENLYMIAALFAGILIGAIFFGGLWLTVKKSLASKNPALWIIGSFFVRTGITLSGFYFISGGNWKRLLVCLLGFIIVRMLSKRFLPVSKTNTKIEVKNEA